jgi:hypothetical protein
LSIPGQANQVKPAPPLYRSNGLASPGSLLFAHDLTVAHI